MRRRSGAKIVIYTWSVTERPADRPYYNLIEAVFRLLHGLPNFHKNSGARAPYFEIAGF